MTDDAVTLGELRRNVEALAVQLSHARSEVGALSGVPAQLAAMSTLWTAQLQAHKEASAASLAHLTEEVDQLKAWQTWLVRIVLGLIVAAVVGLVVTKPVR